MERKAQEFEKTGGTEAPYTPPAADPKAVTNLTKMFKAMKGAAAGSSSLGQSMMAFGPLGIVFEMLAPLLEIITPFIDIIGGLLQAIMIPILQAIMPLLQPIFKLLISLMPIFKILGQLIGAFITWLFGEGGLITIFQWLWDVLVGIGTFIATVFMVIWEVIWAFLVAMGEGIMFIFNVIASVVIGIINVIIFIINAVMTVLTLGFWENISLIPMPVFDDGGRMLQDGMAKMKAGEIAVTGNQLGELTAEIVELKEITLAGIEAKEFRKKFE